MEWRLLQGVPAEQVRQLLSVARRRTFRKGEVVFHRGDPADSLHLISKGRFKVVVMTPLGDQATIAIRGPGDSFGEMAIMGEGGHRSATIEALEPAETFCVLERDFLRLRREYEAIDALLLSFLAEEVRTLNERLLEALYVPVEKRAARRLTELLNQYGPHPGETVIPLTQEELAGLVGTTRTTINQILREFERKGLVELRRGQTIVCAQAALAARAG